MAANHTSCHFIMTQLRFMWSFLRWDCKITSLQTSQINQTWIYLAYGSSTIDLCRRRQFLLLSDWTQSSLLILIWSKFLRYWKLVLVWLTEAVCLVGEGPLWAAAQTLAFVQLEAGLTLGAEVPAETVLAVQRATLWEEGDRHTSGQ